MTYKKWYRGRPIKAFRALTKEVADKQLVVEVQKKGANNKQLAQSSEHQEQSLDHTGLKGSGPYLSPWRLQLKISEQFLVLHRSNRPPLK
jgi:hypothetical protein